MNAAGISPPVLTHPVYAIQRPRLFLDTFSTNSTAYVDLVKTKISEDALGVNFFTLAIDPDANALYNIIIGNIYKKIDLEITAIFKLELPMLRQGLYQGFYALVPIQVQHKTTDPAITVKTGLTLSLVEVLKVLWHL